MFRFNRSPLLVFSLLATVSMAVNSTHAGIINYGDFGPDALAGSTMYLGVTESSGTDAVPLFDTPALSADTLDFAPKTFVASAVDGSSDLTDGQLNFDMMALPGTAMTSLLITEGGDYTLFGTGTAATQIAAGLSVDITILEVDGVALASPVSLFASSSITRDLANDGPVVSTSWSNGVLLDFAPALAGNNIGYTLGVTKMQVVIDDTLVAISEDLSTALISKKDFTLEPATTGNPIPEPASVMLMGLGVFTVLNRRRSR